MYTENQEIVSLDELGKFLFDDYEPEVKKEGEDEKEELEIQSLEEDQEVNLEEEEEEDSIFENNPPKEIQEAEQEKDKQSEENINSSHLAKVVKDFVRDSVWEDLSVEHDGVVYESLSDLADKVEITEELFKGLVETQTQNRVDKISEKSIILEDGVDPTKERLIKAIATGLKQYEPFLDAYDNFIEPLKELDLSIVNNAVALVSKFYKEVNKWDDEYIEFKIQQHLKNKDILDTAEDTRNEYVASYEQILIEKEKEEKEVIKAIEQREREERKEFKTKMKEGEYSDPFIAKAMTLIYSKDNGKAHWVKEIEERIKNPEFRKEFAHWMLDMEDYIKKKVAPEKRKDKLKTVQLINVLGAANKTKTAKKDDDPDDNLLNIVGYKM